MGLNKIKLLLSFLLLYTEADSSYSHRPMDLMADLTNDLGVCILQIQSALQPGNTAFSPYGVMSMSILLFEGATGNTALEIMKVLNLPWNTLLTRIGFRDMNRHLKTYFKSDGFLRGLIMSRDDVCFHPSYQKLLRIYGFEEPDKALTYPCNGFTPYATTTTTFASTSTEAVTVTSPSSTNETAATTEATSTVQTSTTTGPPTDETENVVTELTQTSQTVMIVNSTTFTPIEAETVNGAFTQIKTDLPSTDTATDFDTKITTAGVVVTNPVSQLALSSDQTTMVANSDGTVPTTFDATTKLTTRPTVFEGAASALTENKFPSTTTGQKKETKTERAPTSTTKNGQKATASMIQPPRNSSQISSKKNVTLGAADRTKTNATSNVASTEISKNNTKNEENTIDDIELANLDFQNFTTFKAATDFTFPPTDASSAFDNLFNRSANELQQFASNANSSVVGNGNFSTPSAFPTTFSNFSSIFSGSTLADDDAFNLNPKNSTFYSTLVNFIENTTEKIKNFLTPQEVNGTASSSIGNITKNATSNESTTLSANDTQTPNQNQTVPNSRQGKMMRNNSSTSTLLAAEKNYINANKANAEANNPRNLPKKSISESNQKPKSAAISISPSLLKRAPNYYNILSLKQSKSISSTYDIKGIKSKVRKVKRETNFEGVGQRVTDEKNTIDAVKLEKRETPKMNSLEPDPRRMKRIPSMNIWQFGDDNKTLVETKYRNYSSDGRERNDFYGSSTASNDYYWHDRKRLPYNNHYFLPPGTEWFTTHGQNVRVPIFSYSAILPFAFIEDLKSKVLEIPLDDQNYQLLLLLPAPEYGIEYLISSLVSYPVRKIRHHLRDTAVYASIPKFSVTSHINLRQALYYLGIRDMFHRYRADLSTMSPDARLFVRNIEQVVTIHVDKFPNTGKIYPVPEPLTERYFLASHPFVYFVIDKESGVGLVTGIMSDPLKQTISFL